MQVNVKGLTGVLHLNLVFMIVLALQSFLAVSSEVYCVNHSKLPVSPQHFQCKCNQYSASVIGALSP